MLWLLIFKKSHAPVISFRKRRGLSALVLLANPATLPNYNARLAVPFQLRFTVTA